MDLKYPSMLMLVNAIEVEFLSWWLNSFVVFHGKVPANSELESVREICHPTTKFMS